MKKSKLSSIVSRLLYIAFNLKFKPLPEIEKQERKSFFLNHLDKTSLGLEIGPSYNPIAPKKDGYNVKIMDHSDQQGLIEKYKDNPYVSTEPIEVVDYVWQGEPYKDLVNGETFNWILASHLVEHTPNFIGFINDCSEILKPGGKIMLVVPDKRYTFDKYRNLTSLSQVIDAYIENRASHSSGTHVEFRLKQISKNKNQAWNRFTIGKEEFKNTIEDAKKALTSNKDTGYEDAHAWVFSPKSFRELIDDLRKLELINMKIHKLKRSSSCEFYVVLEKDS